METIIIGIIVPVILTEKALNANFGIVGNRRIAGHSTNIYFVIEKVLSLKAIKTE